MESQTVNGPSGAAGWRRIALAGRGDGFAEEPSTGGGVVAVGMSWRLQRGPVPVLAVHDVDGSPAMAYGHVYARRRDALWIVEAP